MDNKFKNVISIALGALLLGVVAPVAALSADQAAKLVAGDGAANDFFGVSVARSGDTAVVGAHKSDGVGSDTGAVYVFTKSGATWTQQAKIFAPDGDPNDFFGYRVAISGDTLIVGARFHDHAPLVAPTNPGAVYVFRRTGTIWTLQAELQASDAVDWGFFGTSVAMSTAGNTVLVGASNSVYVFTDSGPSWDQQAKLTPSQAANSFGISVALAGETAIVGTFESGTPGSAYVFTRSGAAWSQQARLTADDGAADDRFGARVSISNNTALIGAPYDDDNGADSGSAYTFTRAGTVWTQQSKLTASDGAAGDQFGFALSLSANTAVVTANGDDFGAAYVFTRTGARVWTEQAIATGSDVMAADRFAWSAVLSGNSVLLGAPGRLFGTPPDITGSIYEFQLERDEVATLLASDGEANDFFGIDVAYSGNTAVIGAYRDDGMEPDLPGLDYGAAYVYVRNSGVWSQQAKLTASDGAATDQFGYRVAIAGDTVIVGVRFHDAIHSDAGAAYVYTRSGTVWTEQAKILAPDGAAGDKFGDDVAVSGDTALIGASGHGSYGAAYVYKRSGGVWSQQDKLTPNQSTNAFGIDVALAGETAIVGTFEFGTPGSAYVFTRSGAAWSQQAKLTANDGAADDRFGARVSISNNTALIGAPYDDDNGVDSGSAYVFLRSAGIWNQQAKLTASDGAANDNFGFAGTVSGNTVVITDNGDSFGSAHVYTRSSGVWTEKTITTPNDVLMADRFGWGLAFSGDTAVLGAPATPFGTWVNRNGKAYALKVASSQVAVTPPSTEPVVVEPFPVDSNGDPVEDAPAVSLDFPSVTEGGTTTVTVSSTAPPLPTGFKVNGLTGGETYFDITTTATVGFPVTICIDYSNFAVADPESLIFAHEEEGAWVDITSSNDITGMVLCGSANSFSFFAIVEVADPLTLLSSLVNAVAALNVKEGIANSLDAKLEAAEKALTDARENDDHAALNVLMNAFINSVEAQRGKDISYADADDLISRAEEIALVLQGVTL